MRLVKKGQGQNTSCALVCLYRCLYLSFAVFFVFCFFCATFPPLCVLSNATNSASIKLNHDHFRCCWVHNGFWRPSISIPKPLDASTPASLHLLICNPSWLIILCGAASIICRSHPFIWFGYTLPKHPLLTLSVRNKRRVSFRRGASHIYPGCPPLLREQKLHVITSSDKWYRELLHSILLLHLNPGQIYSCLQMSISDGAECRKRVLIIFLKLTLKDST